MKNKFIEFYSRVLDVAPHLCESGKIRVDMCNSLVNKLPFDFEKVKKAYIQRGWELVGQNDQLESLDFVRNIKEKKLEKIKRLEQNEIRLLKTIHYLNTDYEEYQRAIASPKPHPLKQIGYVPNADFIKLFDDCIKITLKLYKELKIKPTIDKKALEEAGYGVQQGFIEHH